MIRIENVTRGAIHDRSLGVAAGQVCRLTVPSRDIKDELFALLAGHAPPEQGWVRLFDTDVYALAEPQRIGLYRRVGAVPEQGGLISNLKAWENILLPAWYHRKLDAVAAEPRVLALLREADPDIGDLRALMCKLPDRLTAPAPLPGCSGSRSACTAKNQAACPSISVRTTRLPKQSAPTWRGG